METSPIGKFTWTDFKSALISGVLAMVLSVGLYIVQIGNIFEIEWYNLVNLGAMALITTIVSIMKSSLTDSNGKFLGGICIKK